MKDHVELMEFSLITWGGVALKKFVARIHLSSLEGEMDILPGYQPFVIALKAGVISCYWWGFDGPHDSYNIQEGMVFLHNKKVTLTTSRAVLLGSEEAPHLS